MAPSARDKRRGVAETLDPKRRVQKNVNNSGRAQPLAATLTRSVAKSTAVAETIAAVQDTQVVASPPAQLPVPTMDLYDETETESEPKNDDFPPLDSTISHKRTADMLTTDEKQDNICTQKEDMSTQNSMLMIKARGLLNLVGPYLEEMETQCPGAGSGFLALITDWVSRAVRGEKIYLKYSEDPHTLKNSEQKSNSSWAAKAANGNIKSFNNSIRTLPARHTPPQGQSLEDRRIMIRLDKDHEARKVDTFLLRQQIQKLIPDSSLVCDVWHTPSSIVILAPTPAKAAAIMQYKDIIANRFGNAIVERQESWTTFIIGPLPKLVTTIDGPQDPLDGLILQEPGLTQMMILDMSGSTFHLIKHINFLTDYNFLVW
ncbi:hypothetical protein EV44_g4105 [Erysiphe necator]|uniref:Uncharacterized protein n=1 Tax=Uncinula necator TaxID=52586 RepID=A0A0B1NZK9_UNCNE|nr:hypothetical protein EV44_g4105 [Erysiphe necator]